MLPALVGAGSFNFKGDDMYEIWFYMVLHLVALFGAVFECLCFMVDEVTA